MPSYLNQDHFWRDLLLFLLLCTCQRVCELFDFKWFGPGDLGSYNFLGPSALFVPPQTNPPPYSARKIFSTGIKHQWTHQTLYILKQITLAASTHQTRPLGNLLVNQTSVSSCLKDYPTGHFVPQTFTGWFGLACLYFSQTEGTGFVVSTCLAEGINLEMTAARLKPRIKQEELWSQKIGLFTSHKKAEESFWVETSSFTRTAYFLSPPAPLCQCIVSAPFIYSVFSTMGESLNF